MTAEANDYSNAHRLICLAILAAAVADVAILTAHYAQPRSFLPPLVLIILGTVALFRLPVGHSGSIVLAVIFLVTLATFVLKWGWALDATQTERAFARRHTNLQPPIHCRPGHQELAGPLFGGKVYGCTFRGSIGDFPVAVDGNGIVAEWP